MTDNVEVKFGAETSKAEQGIDRIGDKLNNLSDVAAKAFEANQLLEFGDKLMELGDKVLEFAEQYAKMGEDLQRATQILGMSAKEFQEFSFAVQLAGGDADSAVQSMTRLEKNIADAGRGAGDALPFFKAVGVSLKDLQQGNVSEITKKIADAFKNTADGVEKVSVALAIGGRGFAQMIPVLNGGSEALIRMNELLKETGAYLTELQEKQFAETDDKMDVMKKSFEGLGITLFDAFRPAIDSVVEGITGLVQGFNNAIKEGGNWHRVMQAIVLVLDAVILGVDTLIQFMRTLWEVAIIAINEIMGRFTALGGIMNDVLSGNFEDIKKNYTAYMKEIEAQTKESIDNIAGYWKGLGARGRNMIDGIQTMGKDGPEAKKEDKPTIKLPKDDASAKAAAAEKLKIETDLINAQQRLYELDLQNQRNALDQAVKEGQITEQEKFQYLIQYTNQAAQIRAQALKAEYDLEGTKVSRKRQINNELVVLERQHATQVAQINRQAQQQQMAQYRQVFTTIGNSFKGMIQGILQGTQTWKEAWANLLTNLLVSFAGMLTEMLMSWIENQIMMAIFGKTESMAIISGHAAEGAAGAYAATAAIPYVGPALAPGAAALAYSNIMAFNALPSYDVGVDNIAFDHVAQVHKGERVMTAGENETFTKALRSMTGAENGRQSSGGGGMGDAHLHFHGTVVDGKSWFMNNKAYIAQALRSAQRGGDSNLNAMQKGQ